MKASDWISVKDKLPKKYERVIVCRRFADNTFFTSIATYTGKERIKEVPHYWFYSDDGFDIDGITHWQKIVLPKTRKDD